MLLMLRSWSYVYTLTVVTLIGLWPILWLVFNNYRGYIRNLQSYCTWQRFFDFGGDFKYVKISAAVTDYKRVSRTVLLPVV